MNKGETVAEKENKLVETNYLMMIDLNNIGRKPSRFSADAGRADA